MVLYLPGAGTLAAALRSQLDAMQAVVLLLERERRALERFDAEAILGVVDEKQCAADALAKLSRERDAVECRLRARGPQVAARVATMPGIQALIQAIEVLGEHATALNQSNRDLLMHYAAHVAHLGRSIPIEPREHPKRSQETRPAPALCLV
jgi:flagellar biosynthesis/type III secretory pathway chaperone